MSSVRKPSHPTTAHGVFEIVEELPPDIPIGSQFGFFTCVGAIAVAGTTLNDPQDIAIKVTSNSSQSACLSAGRFYSASLRLIKRENDLMYTAYYTAKQPIDLCASADGPDIVNQTTMCGLGIVVLRNDASTDENGESVLRTDIRHTDWDPQAKKLVSFDVTYITPKKGTLSNAHGLFQLGRELFLTGLIVDWDTLKKTWIVQTLTVSVTSGHQTLKASPNSPIGPDPNDSPRKRRFVGYNTLAEIPHSLTSQSTSSPAQTTSVTHTPAPYTEARTSDSSVPESHAQRGKSTYDKQATSPVAACVFGEELALQLSPNKPEGREKVEVEDDIVFKNTYGKGRTKRDILNDARKNSTRK